MIKEYVGFQHKGDSNTQALTIPATLWPLAIGNIQCPKELSSCLNQFSESYSKKHHKRKI